MTAYAIDALAYCRSMLGHGYIAGSCRCETWCTTQDCSGLIVAACRTAGLNIACINSAAFAVWGRQAGTLISEDEAIHTPFGIGIKGPNGGEGGNGPLGHIVPFVGDGQHTYEAMGTHYGIVVGSATGRGFVRWMKVPGLTYGPKPAPAPTFHPERTMIVQQFHYNANGDAQRIPDHIPATRSDGTPHPRAGAFVCCTIGPSADGKGLVLKDGASFVGAGKKDFADDYWPSPDVAAHGRILSCTRIAPAGSPQILVVKHEDREQITHRLT